MTKFNQNSIALIAMMSVATLFTSHSETFADGFHWNGGKIVGIASVDDYILFGMEGGTEGAGRPSCGTKRFAARKDTAHVAIILMLYSKGVTGVNVQGHNECIGNAQKLYWIDGNSVR